MGSCKAVLALAVMVAAAVLADVSAQGTEMGSVQVINEGITEGISMKHCLGPDGSKTSGEAFIPFPGNEYIEFRVNTLSRGWTCDFEYRSAGTGVLHTATVRVWQGILSAASTDVDEELPSLISITTVPCIHCNWKVYADGFYRADDKNRQVFTRLAGWTPA